MTVPIPPVTYQPVEASRKRRSHAVSVTGVDDSRPGGWCFLGLWLKPDAETLVDPLLPVVQKRHGGSARNPRNHWDLGHVELTRAADGTLQAVLVWDETLPQARFHTFRRRVQDTLADPAWRQRQEARLAAGEAVSPPSGQPHGHRPEGARHLETLIRQAYEDGPGSIADLADRLAHAGVSADTSNSR